MFLNQGKKLKGKKLLQNIKKKNHLCKIIVTNKERGLRFFITGKKDKLRQYSLFSGAIYTTEFLAVIA